MAKKPTDLTSKSWNKLKELTVPKTGFGDKLDAYEKARKVTEVLGTRKLATFKAAGAALDVAVKHIPTAQAKCNKTLHKDTIAALEAYKALFAAEGLVLNKEAMKYQGNIDRTLDRLKVCEASMKVHEQTMTALVKASVDKVTNAVTAKKTVDARGVRQDRRRRAEGRAGQDQHDAREVARAGRAQGRRAHGRPSGRQRLPAHHRDPEAHHRHARQCRDRPRDQAEVGPARAAEGAGEITANNGARPATGPARPGRVARFPSAPGRPRRPAPGGPLFTTATARFSAAPSFAGSLIGPSAHTPCACASLAKSIAGLSITLPIQRACRARRLWIAAMRCRCMISWW